MKRTVKRWLGDVMKGRQRVRVVALGSAGCGKTVFLTSLASHLRCHEPEVFRLNGWEATWETELLPDEASERLPAFPYAKYRKEFEKPIPEFPEKTTEEMSVLRLPLVLKKDSRERAVLLELLDLPGERVADLVMANKDYRAWCEWMSDVFVKDKFSESYRTYIEKSMTANCSEDLFAAYKEHLLCEYERLSPWITPSVVKLTNGSAMGFRKEIDDRHLGVDAAHQFVPLPVEAFQAGHGLNRFVRKFDAAYRRYRKRVVTPIARWLAEADQLVYLVDVLGILNKGIAAYDAEAAFGSDVIGMFKAHKTRVFLGWIVDRLSGLFRTRLKGAHLVATKADIAFGKIGGENMCNLARQILGKSMRDLGLDLPENYVCACAAVNTVRESSTDRAVARQNKDSNDETTYSQLVVPEKWPDGTGWGSGNYPFEDTYPRFDPRRNAAPPQIGLDDLVFSILKANCL